MLRFMCVNAQVPTITSFTPQSGPIGTSVTITGTNFSPTPANNIVFFGATKETATAATTTQLTVTVPTGATYQPITVTVNGLTAYSSAPFIVTFPGGGGIDVNSFASKVDFTAGTYPLGVAIGDVDGDGKPDMVGGNYGSNTVSVFRSLSVSGSITSSSFDPNVDFTTGGQPWGAVIGDVDGDGKPDMVVANLGSAAVSVFRNTSISGFITSSSFDPNVDFATGTSPWGVAIGDLDGDGKPDMIVSNNASNTVSVFRNTSFSGSITPSSFDPKVDFTTGTSPRGVAIGDLDGDSKLDFIVGTANSGTVSAFRNTSVSGSISFAPMVDFATGAFPQFVAIGDVDGDGKPDMVVSNFSSNSVSVFRNTSVSGSITFDSNVDFLTGTNPTGVAISDVDGDSKPDVVVTNYFNSTVSVFRNKSVSGSITASSFDSKVDFTTGTNPQGVAIGDVDGDGKPDLVISSSNASTLSVLRNTILASEPTAQSPGPITFSNITIDSFDGTFPVPSPAPDGYLVLMSENIPDFVPVDGVSYNYLDVVGTVGGKNIYVVQNGSFPDFTINNINPPVTLFFKVYSFNGSGPTINYLTSVAPLSGSQAPVPLPPQPTTQASNLIITQPFASTLQLTWTNGNGTSRLVVGRGGGPVNQAPADGVTYAASSSFTVGDDLSGGNYVVYNGSGNSVTVTDIQPGTVYQFFVFEYNGTGGSENYLVSTASGNPASFGTDTIAPTLSTLSPADNATGVALNSNLVVTFNEAIQKGTGNISIRKISDGSELTIAVTGSNVTISNATLTIDPAADMSASTEIYVNIDNTAIKDLAGNSFTGISNATTWNFSTLDNTPPIVASNSTPDKILPGTPLLVSANFIDEGPAVFGKIQYRPIAGVAPNNFIIVDMNYITGDTFEYTILANEVTELGVEYKYLLTDLAGNDNSASQTLYKTRIRHEGGLPIPYPNPGRDVSNYRIITVPLDLDNKSLNSVIGSWLGDYDPTQWTMYRWEGGPRFVELNGNTQMEVGKGYWFLTPISTELNSGPGTTPDVGVSSPFRITLQPGWTQIGNPYNFDISWADVLAANPTQAINLGSSIRVFRGTVSDVDELQKFEGGFVKNTSTSNVIIDIPVAKNASINGRKGQADGIINSLDQPAWEILFDLKEGKTEYNLGGLGMHPEAAVGFDFLDDFNLPRFFEYLEVKFPKERVGMTYTKDIVPTLENFVWEFAVESNLKEKEISIGWDNSYFGSAKEIYLLDVAEHRFVDMRMQEHYTFSHSPSKEFKVVYGNSDFVKKELIPNRIVLYDPYPNPFTDQVSIGYALPQESVTMNAEIGIYNALGARISTLSAPRQAGTGHWIWEGGANPSGLYFVNLRLGDQVVTKKLLKR